MKYVVSYIRGFTKLYAEFKTLQEASDFAKSIWHLDPLITLA